ncbi:MAG: DUF2079 domain-containing protein [Clostridia bacterium]|nr:DUF2079 domain-containing protein [Clostridia bacterium]
MNLFGRFSQKNKTQNTVEQPAKRRFGRLSALSEKGLQTLAAFALSPAFFIVLAFDAFLSASIISHLFGNDFGTKQFTDSVYLPLYVTVFGVVFVLLTALTAALKTQKIGHWTMLVLTALYACILSAEETRNLYFCIAIGVVVFIAAKYLCAQDKLSLSKVQLSDQASVVLLTVGCVGFTAVVGLATVVRYTNFGGATFDLGIFTQMFEYMRTTGIPYTTVERDGLVSHFAVHFSPVFYLLLPGYMLWSHPSYLLVMQALAVALCVFPLRRICRRMGLSSLASTAVGLIWLFYPSTALGCCNDFHENKFLPLFLFWLIAMLLENKRIGIAVFTLLSLSVKEDVAVYIVTLGLFWLFYSKKKGTGFALIAAAMAWFVFATKMIEHFDGEPMISRFSAYYPENDSSWFGIIKTVVLNIGYLLTMIMNAERMEFLLWMFLPILFAPFLAKNARNLLLLLPMLVINLMPTLATQYDVFYQYTYGPATLIVFASVLAFSQMKDETRRFCITASVLLCMVFGVGSSAVKFGYYFKSANAHRQDIILSEELLDSIPADATITARDYVVPHLYDRKELYTVPNHYSELTTTDYYVVDKRQDGNKYNIRMEEFINSNEYELIMEQGYLQLWEYTGER